MQFKTHSQINMFLEHRAMCLSNKVWGRLHKELIYIDRPLVHHIWEKVCGMVCFFGLSAPVPPYALCFVIVLSCGWNSIGGETEDVFNVLDLGVVCGLSVKMI